VPLLLFFVAALFSLPPLAYSLFHLFSGTEADGKFFCLFFGLFILWIFLEFVATRERIQIDPTTKVLMRRVSGVFRNKKQVIDLSDIQGIELEMKRDDRGTRKQYLYMYGNKGKFLLNSPAKGYLDHGELGRLLSKVTDIPYREQ
jgi:hypothetical protein